ncbi:Transposable element Tc3 transposase [Anthophora plagiata]
MEQFRNDSQYIESSDDGLEVEEYNESANNSYRYDSLQDIESDVSDYIVPPKRRNVARIVSGSEESQDDEEEDSGERENSNNSEEWEDVTEKDDLPFNISTLNRLGNNDSEKLNLPRPLVLPAEKSAKRKGLNPIENLWGILTRKVCGNCKQYSTINELWKAVNEAWSSIQEDILQSLISSMPHRIFEIIRRNGGSTNY